MLDDVHGSGDGGWCVSMVTWLLILVLTTPTTTTHGLSESPVVSERPLTCTSPLPENNKNRYDSSLRTLKEKNEDGKIYRYNIKKRSLSVMPHILAQEHGKSLRSELTYVDSVEEYGINKTSQHKNKSLVRSQQSYVSQPSTLPPSTTTERIYQSRNDYLLLCESPPLKFSPDFLGTSSQFCLPKRKHILFPDVRRLCNTLYGIMYNEKDIDVVTVTNVLRGWTRRVYFDANYMRLCIPLLNRFDRCRTNSLMTVCSRSRMVFPNLESCKPPPHNKLVFGHLLAPNIRKKHATCFAKLCRGFYKFERGRINNLRYRIFNLNLYYKIKDCSFDLDPESFGNASTTYTTYNTHWPLCYGMHQVVWAGNPSDHGLNGAWSYLPASCRAGEVVLLVMVGVVAVVGITGNSLVVLVMMKGSCRCFKISESILLRTSLAVSDLLMGVFVVIPSFIFHLDPLMSPEKYLKVDIYEGRVHIHRENKTIPMSSAEKTSDPWKIMQMIFMCVCSIASLIVLSMLSVERYVITRRALKYKDYITVPRVVLAITLTWLMGVCQASLIIYNEHFNSFLPFYTFPKLTIPTPVFNSDNLLLLSMTMVVTSTLGLSTVCTSVFSTLAIINFVRGLSRVTEEWKVLNITKSPQYKKETRHIIVTQLLMTGLYLLSTLPLIINFLSTLLGFKLSIELESYFLLHYLKWWVFVASSAWNPWLYNFRSWQFRKEVTRTLIAMMPNCLRKKYLAATMTPHATDERVARRLLKVGLLPYDGQLPKSL